MRFLGVDLVEIESTR